MADLRGDLGGTGLPFSCLLGPIIKIFRQLLLTITGPLRRSCQAVPFLAQGHPSGLVTITDGEPSQLATTSATTSAIFRLRLFGKSFSLCGERGWNRTINLLIKRNYRPSHEVIVAQRIARTGKYLRRERAGIGGHPRAREGARNGTIRPVSIGPLADGGTLAQNQKHAGVGGRQRQVCGADKLDVAAGCFCVRDVGFEPGRSRASRSGIGN